MSGAHAFDPTVLREYDSRGEYVGGRLWRGDREREEWYDEE